MMARDICWAADLVLFAMRRQLQCCSEADSLVHV